MSKKTGIVFVIIGAVLILSALLLYFHNIGEDKKAGQISEDLLSDIKAEIVTYKVPAETTGTDSADETEEIGTEVIDEMPSVKVNGYEFIGYITIPSINVELPVLSDWNYVKLDMAPCRQAGSVITDDLVIAAHNYTSHFAKLGNVKVGEDVSITTMNGNTIPYKITDIKILDGKAVEDVLNSDHDLVLYTCTYEGSTRIVVFCDRA